MTATPAAYWIMNRRTGRRVGKASTLKGARRAMDRRDNEYGAYVHYVYNPATGREEF